MKTKTIGFVGGGRVARIFLDGWTRARRLPEQVTVSDPNADTLGELKSRHPTIQTTPDNGVAAAAELVFVAVHPPVLAATVAEITAALRPGAILILLAPKFTLARLTSLLGGFSRLVRVIPNAPSIIGRGFNPLTFAAGLSVAEKSDIGALLDPLGEHPEVPEEQLEAYAVLSAMGPTYLWFQLQALREAAAGFGMSDTDSTRAIAGMTEGAVRTLFESGLTPGEVMDLIPVKPLAEMEPQVTELYRTRLSGIYSKIKP